MELANAFAASARQRLFTHDELRHGITERQVDRRMRRLILEEDGDRSAFVILQDPTPGQATDKHKRVYEAALEVNQKITHALKPGITCAQLFEVCMKAIADSTAEIDDPWRVTSGRMGHGMGMIISAEPGVREGDVEFLYEDVHVITETGSQRLTDESNVLHERVDYQGGYIHRRSRTEHQIPDALIAFHHHYRIATARPFIAGPAGVTVGFEQLQ